MRVERITIEHLRAQLLGRLEKLILFQLVGGLNCGWGFPRVKFLIERLSGWDEVICSSAVDPKEQVES